VSKRRTTAPSSWDEIKTWDDLEELPHDDPFYQQGPTVVFGPSLRRWIAAVDKSQKTSSSASTPTTESAEAPE
jgi:hypothetical protein